MGVVGRGRQLPRRGMGGLASEVTLRPSPCEMVLVVAVTPVRRSHLGLNPGFGSLQGREFDQPEALPMVLRTEQSKPLQVHQAVSTRYRQHQVDMLL